MITPRLFVSWFPMVETYRYTTLDNLTRRRKGAIFRSEEARWVRLRFKGLGRALRYDALADESSGQSSGFKKTNHKRTFKSEADCRDGDSNSKSIDCVSNVRLQWDFGISMCKGRMRILASTIVMMELNTYVLHCDRIKMRRLRLGSENGF